jgi:hypothetical protein
MHPVIVLSTQHLEETEVEATATYLLGDHPPPLASLPDAVPVAARLPGRTTYLAVCAPATDLTARVSRILWWCCEVSRCCGWTIRATDPTVLDGIGAQDFPNLESMQAMLGFADKLADRRVGDLGNYLRDAWRPQKPDLTPALVRSMQ